MKDQDKTKAQLIDELKSLRKSLAEQPEEGNTFKREVQKVKDQKIKQALKESEEKFRTICENAPVMINSFDENGRCLFMNREIGKTLGWTAKELKASDDPLSRVYPDSKIRNRVLESIKRADGLFREYQVAPGLDRVSCFKIIQKVTSGWLFFCKKMIIAGST